VLGILLTAAACLAAGKIGFASTGNDAFFSPFWPMSGVAVGCVLLGGPWMAVGVYAGVAAQNVLIGMQNWTTWVGPLGIVLEALFACWLLSRLLGPRPRLTDLRGVAAFLFVAPWLPAAANGLIGVGLLYADEAAVMEQMGREFAIFVMANGSGIALFAPAFAVWTAAPDASWWKRFAILAPLVLGTAWLVFYSPFAWPAYALFLPLLAAAVVLGLRGTAPLLAAVTAIAAFSLRQESWALAGRETPVAAYGQMYVFLGITAVCALAVAAIVGQYRRRLEHAARGADSAGLTVWHWDAQTGLTFDRIGDDCLLAPRTSSALAPEELFDPAKDRGTRETEIDGRPALSFWEVSRRLPTGAADAAGGVILDLSERLSLEQARRQAWQSEIELRNLRASLAPHLLFNCLAAVRGIVRSDPERARRFIDHLSRFLRDSTNAQARETIPLLDEWQLCEDFLALQAMRYERELPRLVEIEGAAYHARVPPMMLLNLVENAVKHGTIDQRHPLVVSARLMDGRLEASVRNHGRLGPPPTARPGGLGIARARLQAVYGGDASLDMVQSGDDVTVAVHLPSQPPPPAAE
jgi:integral membrane sensor domain MASE1